MKIRILVFLVALALTITVLSFPLDLPATAAATYYVDAVSGNNQTGDGSQLKPWKTITYALSHVSPGASLVVLPGTYNSALGEVFPINIPAGINLAGLNRETTLISGQSGVSVIYIGSISEANPINSDTGIKGLTLQNGNIGLEVYASKNAIVSPVISDVRIRWNITGIKLNTSDTYQDGATLSPVITNTQVISNTGDGIYIHSYGYFKPSAVTPTIGNTRVLDNGGNGIYVLASAVSANGTYAAPRIIDTVIAGNTGHGLYDEGAYQGWAKPLVERSSINNNGGYGVYWDEGFNGGNVQASLINTIIANNQGGGVYIGQRNYSTGNNSFKIINSTVVNNANYGVYWKNSSNVVSPLVRNTILWNTTADDLYSSGSTWQVDQVGYSIIEDGDLDGLNGNFKTNPRLLDDFHLDNCSPAVDSGTEVEAPVDDFDGDPRPLGAAFDIGADEIGMPCWLKVDKQVSTQHARIGDTLAYTITLQNTTVITPINVLLTDTLPLAVNYLPGSVEASQGTAQYNSGTISWQDTIAPGALVTVSLQTKVVQGNTTIYNFAKVDTGLYGVIRSPAIRTDVDPFKAAIPMIARNFCADFFDDFSSPTNGWPVGEGNNVRAEYLNGQYRVLVKAMDYMFGARPSVCNRQNYAVQVTARWAGNPGFAYGLLFGIQGDFERFYVFLVNADYQEYALLRYDGSGYWTLLRDLTPSWTIHPGAAENVLRALYDGTTIRLIINGNNVDLISDAAIKGETGAGLIVFSYADLPDADARFDNFSIQSISSISAQSSSQIDQVGVVRTLPEGTFSTSISEFLSRRLKAIISPYAEKSGR